MLDGVDEGQAGARARTALVVAVNPDRRDALGRELTTAGIEPELATDGRQAERSAKAALPDVLILDQGLPGLALFRLYSTLRGLPGGSDVPIFFVGQTGTDTPTDHYLSAELSLREVVDRVRDDLGLSALPPTAPPPTLGAAVPTTELPPAAAPTEPDLGGSTEVAGPGLATGTSSALAGVTFEPAVDEPRPLLIRRRSTSRAQDPGPQLSPRRNRCGLSARRSAPSRIEPIRSPPWVSRPSPRRRRVRTRGGGDQVHHPANRRATDR
jgi:CheY-like chemotaxis protein